jgi:hypothetical protein
MMFDDIISDEDSSVLLQTPTSILKLGKIIFAFHTIVNWMRHFPTLNAIAQSRSGNSNK